VENLAGSSAGPDASVYQRQLTSAVRELLARLPEPQAEALALHCVMGCTVAEIAATSRVSIETVRSRLRLAKHALRHQMQTNPVLHEIVGGAS
jgi:RNA polymerase sigma-70 factor (ECF subfamily)